MKTIWPNYVRLSKIIIHSQVQGRMRWGTPLRNMKSILCHLSSLLLQFLLLERASSWLNTISEQLESHSLCKMETLELTIESNLLKGNLYMQQGHTALWFDDFMHVYCVHVYILPILTIFMSPPPFSFDTAVSSLKLLQTSPVTVRGSWAVSDWAKYLYKALTESSRLILECLVTATVTLQPELNFNSLSNHNKTAEMICCIHDLS